MRRQKPGLLVDGRVGRREIGHVEDRDAPDEHLRVLVIDRVRLLVLDDARGPDLPERRPLGVILAGFAGGVGALLQDGHVAVRPLDPGRGEPGLVGGQHLDAVDEAVAKIVAELEPAAVDDVAVFVRHLGVAFGVDPLGRAVVNNAVRLKNAALIEKLDRADRRNGVLVLVVNELVGVDDQLVGRLCGLSSSRPARTAPRSRSDAGQRRPGTRGARTPPGPRRVLGRRRAGRGCAAQRKS